MSSFRSIIRWGTEEAKEKIRIKFFFVNRLDTLERVHLDANCVITKEQRNGTFVVAANFVIDHKPVEQLQKCLQISSSSAKNIWNRCILGITISIAIQVFKFNCLFTALEDKSYMYDGPGFLRRKIRCRSLSLAIVICWVWQFWHPFEIAEKLPLWQSDICEMEPSLYPAGGRTTNPTREDLFSRSGVDSL